MASAFIFPTFSGAPLIVKVQTSSIKRKPISGQSIQHYIKKSSMNLGLLTSLATDT